MPSGKAVTASSTKSKAGVAPANAATRARSDLAGSARKGASAVMWAWVKAGSRETQVGS